MAPLRILIVDGLNRMGLSNYRALKYAGGYQVYVTTGKKSIWG